MTTKKTTSLTDDPTVKSAVDEIKEVLTSNSKDDAKTRYLVGRKVNEIRTQASDEKYGKRVVATIAREVGLTAASLYQYADVARTWAPEDFEVLKDRAAAARLTFSHFIELTHPDHGPERDARLEHAIIESLSVRKVRALRTAATGRDHARQGDVLERFKIEGPSEPMRKLVDAALKKARLEQCDLEERIHLLEEAHAECDKETWLAGGALTLNDEQEAAE